jgi:hypothetical protein
MADGDLNLAAIILLVTALLLAIAVLSQILSSYTSAYLSAPSEITTFVDAADFSIQENESYDRDIQKVQRLEDKMRLGRLLREIQRCGDDLREELNRILIDESSTRLRTSARLLWAGKRCRLEDRVRRLDMLRMRFLVVYMGLVAAKSTAAESSGRDPEKMSAERNIPKMTLRPSLPHALTESITKKPPPLRRLTTQAMGHNDSVSGERRQGWAGVIQELQRSPVMHKRHASIERSIETAMGRPP